MARRIRRARDPPARRCARVAPMPSTARATNPDYQEDGRRHNPPPTALRCREQRQFRVGSHGAKEVDQSRAYRRSQREGESPPNPTVRERR